MIKNVISLFFGVGVGISSTFLHNSYHPIGLIVALVATGLGIHLVSQMYISKFANALFAAGWLFVIIQASTLGNGGELLIESNDYGNLLVILGTLILLFSIFRRRRIN